MLRITCPKCRKTSYTPDVESFYPCTYCGFKFSGKYGPDRRRESRLGKRIPFVFSYRDKDFEASTSDLSETGVGIKISGSPTIKTGDVLNLAISDITMVAKVMWTSRLSRGTMAGFQRVH